MPGKARATAAAFSTVASTSRPGAGMTWIVNSRATSACHSLAAAAISITAPVVSEARNVMIATTATSARPEIELRGTSGVSKRGKAPPGMRGGAVKSLRKVSVISVINMQPAVVQHEAAGIVLVHQGDVVGGDQHRCSGFVELDEQPQQPLRERGVDVAGRLVGEQQLRARDHRTGDRGALLFPAREHGRQRPHPLAKADP